MDRPAGWWRRAWRRWRRWHWFVRMMIVLHVLAALAGGAVYWAESSVRNRVVFKLAHGNPELSRFVRKHLKFKGIEPNWEDLGSTVYRYELVWQDPSAGRPIRWPISLHYLHHKQMEFLRFELREWPSDFVPR